MPTTYTFSVREAGALTASLSPTMTTLMSLAGVAITVETITEISAGFYKFDVDWANAKYSGVDEILFVIDATATITADSDRYLEGRLERTDTVSTANILTDTTAILVDTAAIIVDTTAIEVDTTAILVDTAAIIVDTTAIEVDTTAIQADTAAILIDTTAIEVDTTAIQADTTAILVDTVAIQADATTILADTTAIKADATTIKADVIAVKADTTSIQADTTAIEVDTNAIQVSVGTLSTDVSTVGANVLVNFEALAGTWTIVGNQMIMKTSGGAVIRTFDLFDSAGAPASTQVFTRQYVS